MWSFVALGGWFSEKGDDDEKHGQFCRRMLGARGLASYVAVLAVLALTVIGSGCGPWASPGETSAEAGRRRERVLRVDLQRDDGRH